jgi:hypothetical protein
MRLSNYLNESSNIETYYELLKNIENECSKYLNLFRKTTNAHYLLYSGRQSSAKWFEDKIRKNRIPVDTPQEIHDMVDDIFKKKTGKRLRSNSLFCVNDETTARTYGKLFYIFPIGNYESWYHPEVADLFTHFNKYSVRQELNLLTGLTVYANILEKIRYEPGFLDKWENYLKNLVDGYKKGLPNKNDIEVMITGDSYYAVNVDWALWISNMPTVKPTFYDWLWGKDEIK